MGYTITSPSKPKGDLTAKNRVWGFFGDGQKMHRENRPQSLQPRRGNPSITTRTASGRLYWPSRDPIKERGGFNVYGMISNDAVNSFDVLGLESDECKAARKALEDLHDKDFSEFATGDQKKSLDKLNRNISGLNENISEYGRQAEAANRATYHAVGDLMAGLGIFNPVAATSLHASGGFLSRSLGAAASRAGLVGTVTDSLLDSALVIQRGRETDALSELTKGLKEDLEKIEGKKTDLENKLKSQKSSEIVKARNAVEKACGCHLSELDE